MFFNVPGYSEVRLEKLKRIYMQMVTNIVRTILKNHIGVITDVSFFFMDGDSAVYTYDATTTRSPFEDFECSFNCMLLDSDILRVLKEDEWTEAEHYCQRKYCQNDS